MSNRITRRAVLRLTGMGSAAAIMAACQPQVVEKVVEKEVTRVVEKEVEKVVKEAVEVEKEVTRVVEQVVEKVVEKGPDIFTGELSLWHNWGNSDGGGLAMLDQVEGFVAQHPEVKMTNVFDAGTDKWMTAIAGGTPPDLLKLQVQEMPSVAQRGALMPLDPFIERDNYDMGIFFDFVLFQTSWRDKFYGINHHPGCIVYYRDLEVFKEVGRSEADLPKSWDEVFSLGMEMSVQEGPRYTRFGFVPQWAPFSWPAHYMLANGATFESADGRTATFDSPQAVEAMEWIVKCTDEICGGYDSVAEFVETSATPEGKGAQWIFPHHRLGAMVYGHWGCFPIGVINPEMEFTVDPFPGGPSGSVKECIFSTGSMVTIPLGAKHWELAWEWLKYLGSYEGGILTQKRTADISGVREAAFAPEIVDTHVGRKRMVEMLEKANLLAYFHSPISNQWTAEMARMGDRILLKEVPIQQAITEAQVEVQKALDEFWATA